MGLKESVRWCELDWSGCG